MKICVVGLGLMGVAIALRLHSRDHEVVCARALANGYGEQDYSVLYEALV